MGKLFTLQFDADAKMETLPKNILEEQCTYLNKDTKEIVIGSVAQYSGSIKSYYITPIGSALMSHLGLDVRPEMGEAFAGKKEDVQTKLGDIGEDLFIYEFYLTSKSTPDYKFRVLFMEYGIMGYPVTIMLEEGISEEINPSAEECTYQIQNREELEELLTKVFSSKRFGEILTKLARLNG